MPRVCNCLGCRMGRLMAEADEEDEAEDVRSVSHQPSELGPRDDMVSYYMERFGMMFPEAVAMLNQENKLRWKGAVEAMVRRHGLDEDDAVSHVLAYAVNQPEMIQ
jgi:hypothetical protein